MKTDHHHYHHHYCYHHPHHHHFHYHYHHLSLSASPGANRARGPLGSRKHIIIITVIITIIIIIIIIIVLVYRHPPPWCQLCLRALSLRRTVSPYLFSKLIPFQHKLDFQLRRLSYFVKRRPKTCLFFQRLFNFRATALIFKLNQGRNITFIEF